MFTFNVVLSSLACLVGLFQCPSTLSSDRKPQLSSLTRVEHSRSEIHIKTPGLWVPWAVFLRYKKAGVATPWSQPIRAQYLSRPMRVLHSVLDEDRWDKAASHKISNWTESEEKLQQRRTSIVKRRKLSFHELFQRYQWFSIITATGRFCLLWSHSYQPYELTTTTIQI